MCGEIVDKSMCQLFPVSQELHILEEVLWHHLRIITFQPVLGKPLFLLRSDGNPIDATLLVMEGGFSGPLAMEEGVVAFLAVEFRLEVSDFPAKDACVHVSVR